MALDITLEQAAAEMFRRRQLRGSLEQWSEVNGFKPAAHHRLLIAHLERLLRGEIKRLAVFMPPGSAKSTYGSILFPSYILANNPKALILAASHTTELAERWGRRVRNLVLEHEAELHVKLQSDSLAAGRWATEDGGEYYAAGALTGIAGFRGLYGLIDDPIRSRQDADSQLVRDRLWDWYLNDFRPRLIPDARQLLIQTRWHEDDLAGRALNHQPWEVLSLPALAKSNDQLQRPIGEPLWNDDDYGYGAQLVELQQTTPPRVWSALYQQEPTPDEGDFFKEEWLHPLDIAPKPDLMRTYGASDYAVTQDGGDYTVHVIFGVDHLNNLYLLDIWRGQTTSDIWVEALCDLVEEYKPLGWAEETGQIKSGVGPFLEQQMRARRVYVNRYQFPTRGDKAVRCRSIQGRIALDGLYYAKNAPWASDWLAEILNFPASKHDDQADAMGLAGQLLDQMVAGRAGKPPLLVLPNDGYSGFGERKIELVDHMTL
jgi:predicted phage terminase large subunit-like protein